MGSLALPKSARLSTRAEFQVVRNKGRSWHGTLMVLSGYLDPAGAPPRVGVITTRKIGCATDRSRTRRRLREIFRAHRPALPAGLWMVIIPRKAAVASPFAALAEEWRALAGRAGYLKA